MNFTAPRRNNLSAPNQHFHSVAALALICVKRVRSTDLLGVVASAELCRLFMAGHTRWSGLRVPPRKIPKAEYLRNLGIAPEARNRLREAVSFLVSGHLR